MGEKCTLFLHELLFQSWVWPTCWAQSPSAQLACWAQGQTPSKVHVHAQHQNISQSREALNTCFILARRQAGHMHRGTAFRQKTNPEKKKENHLVLMSRLQCKRQSQEDGRPGKPFAARWPLGPTVCESRDDRALIHWKGHFVLAFNEFKYKKRINSETII